MAIFFHGKAGVCQQGCRLNSHRLTLLPGDWSVWIQPDFIFLAHPVLLNRRKEFKSAVQVIFVVPLRKVINPVSRKSLTCLHNIKARLCSARIAQSLLQSQLIWPFWQVYTVLYKSAGSLPKSACQISLPPGWSLHFRCLSAKELAFICPPSLVTRTKNLSQFLIYWKKDLPTLVAIEFRKKGDLWES